MTRTPRSKRSRVVPVTLVGAAAFGMSACQEERVETAMFPDVESCIQAAGQEDNWWTEGDCRTSLAQAEDRHDDTAPRYANKDLCREEHDGACYAAEGSDGGSFFLPLMAGYMMGNMSGSANPAAQPLFRNGSGDFATPKGQVANTNFGTTSVRSGSFDRAESRAGAAPLTRSAVNSRGGFGASRSGAGARGVGG